ncbi:hypothetical protein JTE90_006097 [Oedothorax gibbosus]|uniref:C2H2-type domain-containing protein n=1 Tax=Oedothorax gibbosus TaxID=931172 RepID=A0AAV6V6U1_9ARAC|nr:hypothetical protein JTE90_006097 [Oedothorax gibbosus]
MENVYNLKDNVACIGSVYSVQVNFESGEGVYMNNSASSTQDVKNMEDNGSSVENINNDAKDCKLENVHCIKVDATTMGGVYNTEDNVCGLSSIKSNASNMNVIYLVKDTVSTTEDVYHVTDTVMGGDNLTADISSMNNTKDNVMEDEVNNMEHTISDMNKDVKDNSTMEAVNNVRDNVIKKEEDNPLPTICPLCPTSFIARKNMYVHLRRRHGVEPNTGGKILCPMLCGTACYRHKDLRTHLEEKHETPIHSEAHDFQDSATFESWKKGVEQSSGQSWVRRISEKNLKRGEAKTYFICHRSGVHRPKSSPCTRKRPETLKIGTTCPSIMEVSRFPDGSIKVLFFTTHVGHGVESPRAPHRKPKRTAVKKSEMLLWNVCVVLPAAGCGARMGGDTPKQFLPLHSKPIICYTVEAFLRLPYVRRVVVVASSVESMAHTLGTACDLEESDRLVVTEGAAARHHSIRCGLRALANNDGFEPGVVIVHDGVRPFVSEEVISGVIHAAKTYGAAGVVCPLVSTVVSTDADGFLDTSLDRSRYRASEMPQAFHYDLITKAYDMATAYDLEYGTECLHLMQKYLNIKAKLIPGDSNLWKVTYHKDIYTAASVVKENQSVGIINSSTWSSLAAILEKCLTQTFKSVQSVGCKLKEGSLRKHPNLVHVCEEADPYPLLERLSALSQVRIFQRTSLAHIFVNAFDPTLNFLEFQRQAKLCAKLLKGANMLVYFVIYTGATETIEELGEVVRSLLFDSNPSISGSVFLS